MLAGLAFAGAAGGALEPPAVLPLTGATFATALSENPLLFVLFYNQERIQGTHLLTNYSLAAQELHQNHQLVRVKLAWLEVRWEDAERVALSKRFGVSELPDIKIFHHGRPHNFEAAASTTSIVDIARWNAGHQQWKDTQQLGGPQTRVITIDGTQGLQAAFEREQARRPSLAHTPRAMRTSASTRSASGGWACSSPRRSSSHRRRAAPMPAPAGAADCVHQPVVHALPAAAPRVRERRRAAAQRRPARRARHRQHRRPEEPAPGRALRSRPRVCRQAAARWPLRGRRPLGSAWWLPRLTAAPTLARAPPRQLASPSRPASACPRHEDSPCFRLYTGVLSFPVGKIFLHGSSAGSNAHSPCLTTAPPLPPGTVRRRGVAHAPHTAAYGQLGGSPWPEQLD